MTIRQCLRHVLLRPGLIAGLWLAFSPAGGRVTAKLPDHATHSERPAFSARVAGLLQESRSIAAVQVELPYRELSFRKSSDGLAARFDLIVLVLRGEQQVSGNLYPESLHVDTRAELHETPTCYRREILIPLEPGEYEVEVAVSEPGSGHEGRLRLGLVLEAVFPGQLRLSPLLFGPCDLDLPVAELFFDPRAVTQVRDPEGAPCVHAELFHPDRTPDSVHVAWKLSSDQDPQAPALEGEIVQPGGHGSTRLRWPLPVEDLWLDTYRLEVAVTAEGRTVRGETTLGVVLENDRALERFFEGMLDVLAIVAPEAEVEELRMAAPEERRAAWEAFWSRRDPSPGTPRNEFKEEFFDRIREAVARFSLGRPGWRTDRGRIFIRYGEPDTVDRRPFQAGQPPTETWHYEQLGLRFVFVDENGYGDYRLVG